MTDNRLEWMPHHHRAVSALAHPRGGIIGPATAQQSEGTRRRCPFGNIVHWIAASVGTRHLLSLIILSVHSPPFEAGRHRSASRLGRARGLPSRSNESGW